jgi:hypothetical protein
MKPRNEYGFLSLNSKTGVIVHPFHLFAILRNIFIPERPTGSEIRTTTTSRAEE